MKTLLLETPAAWADAVAALPAAGALPTRTVLVPSERHAHALRRALARSGRGAVLAGTRFLGPLTAAIEVLRTAGVAFTPGEDDLRPARLLALFRGDALALEHFDLPLLRTTRGWDEAFAAAIGDLEAAGLGPEDLPKDTASARDLARVWARVAADAGTSFSSARVYAEAAAVLARDPRAWPFDGATLAVATGHETATAARFLCAVPGVTIGIRVVRPVTERHLHRVAALYGADASAALAGFRSGSAAPLTPALSPRVAGGEGDAPRAPRELDLLSAYLFAGPGVLAAPDRPRSSGPDGTVELEEHSGVEAELEATALWVTRQVLEHGRPLEDVAVLVPAQDPLAGLVADRLARLPFPSESGTLPVCVAGGLPAVSTAAGARILAVLRALRSFLSADTLAPVLAALRLDGDAERGHLSHGEAMEVAYGLGTIGGHAADPAGALQWSARAAARVAELEIALARVRADDDSASREAWRLDRTSKNLRAIRPALDALTGVARLVVEDAPLAAIAETLHGFLARWLLAPGEGAALPARLAEAIAPASGGSLGKALTGDDALAVIEDRLLALRVPQGRFGEPAVHVGTVAGAAGLDFEAVRVIGLCEGVLPSQPREDPVVPGALRAALERAAPGRVIARAEDRVAAQLQALVAVLRGARSAIALSAPRVDLARTEREPASIFIDAAAALARPDAATGKPAEAVPDGRALRRDAFLPAAAAAAAFRAAYPVAGASWLDRVARVAAELPPTWRGEPALDLARIAAIRKPTGPLGAADGVCGTDGPFPAVPGLTAERPISASALGGLLQCPRMFLLQRILGWDEPAGAPSLRELDAASFGSLLHRAIEVFYRAHGEAFGKREGTLARWQQRAREMADAEFDAFLSEYPLVGEGVRLKERERLHDGVREFLRYDWRGDARRYVGVELAFGPLEIELPPQAGGEGNDLRLFVRGYIDRVDVEGTTTVVRDLKSGKPHPRRKPEESPTAHRDLQIGLYQLAAKAYAREWKTTSKVSAAYAYASGRTDVEERAFRDDAPALEAATKEWLATAAHLLAARAFPPTTDASDCEYCPFRPICGDGVHARACSALAEVEDGPLALFRALKLGDDA